MSFPLILKSIIFYGALFMCRENTHIEDEGEGEEEDEHTRYIWFGQIMPTFMERDHFLEEILRRIQFVFFSLFCLYDVKKR